MAETDLSLLDEDEVKITFTWHEKVLSGKEGEIFDRTFYLCDKFGNPLNIHAKMYWMKNAASAEYHSIGKGQSAGPLQKPSFNLQEIVKNTYMPHFESVHNIFENIVITYRVPCVP